MELQHGSGRASVHLVNGQDVVDIFFKDTSVSIVPEASGEAQVEFRHLAF